MNTRLDNKISIIDFDSSLSFFLKDKNQYKPSNCHMNVYERFYDLNHNIIDENDDRWFFVTGLLLIEYNNKKICYVHSWLEFDDNIIDVTAFANSDIGTLDVIPKQLIQKYKEIMSQYKYVAVSKLRSSKITFDFNQISFKNGFSSERTRRGIEDYLLNIVDSTKNNTRFRYYFCDKLGYEFKDGNYKEQIDLEIKI